METKLTSWEVFNKLCLLWVSRLCVKSEISERNKSNGNCANLLFRFSINVFKQVFTKPNLLSALDARICVSVLIVVSCL